MPPPPPPSKSYLLVLDTDSEDEQEDESYSEQQRELRRRLQLEQLQRETQTVTMPSNPPTTELGGAKPPSTTSSSRCRRPHVVEDDEDEDDDDSEGQESPTAASGSDWNPDQEIDGQTGSDSSKNVGDKPLTKTQKKNKRRRKKKKKRTSKEAVKYNVTFSDVSIQTYARCFGVDTVPGDGGWPLGMEMEPMRNDNREKENSKEDAFRISIDDYESHKQERLKARWDLVKNRCKDEVVAKMMKRPASDSDDLIFETRQWDYKGGVKNPLFKLLHEDERRALFLAPTTPINGRERSSSIVSETDEFDSGSFNIAYESHSSSSSPPKRRTRSSSVSSSSECFNDKYDQVYVHHVRNELEQLRNQRSANGSIGCDCRKLTVYIPPSGGGGKRAQHRRMKPQKLAQELKKRGLYNPKASREEMEIELHKAVEAEPCCSSNDCLCSRNGLECQSDACSCWHDSHVHEKKHPGSNGKFVSVDEIRRRCGNTHGMYAVDLNSIDKARVATLSNLNLSFCQPVGTM